MNIKEIKEKAFLEELCKISGVDNSTDQTLKRIAYGTLVGIPLSTMGYMAGKRVGRELYGNKAIKMFGEKLKLKDLTGRFGAGLSMSGGMIATHGISKAFDERKKSAK